MAYRETVLVTGAGGCVGTHLVKELLGGGYTVKATDLPGKPFDFGGYRVKTVRGDLTDRAFVEDLPFGVDHIIHAGASVDISLPWPDLKAVNLDATVHLWNRAVDIGIESFLFFSSGSIYRGQDRPICEADPLEPVGNYEKSKFMAERALMRSKLAGADTRLVTLRPGLIIGPFGTALMSSIATFPPLLKHYLGFGLKLYGGPRTNIVHALDAARAAVHLLKNGEDQETYNVANDEALPYCDFFNIAAREYGLTLLPAPPLFIPPRDLLKYIMPVASRPEGFWAINIATEKLWERLKKRYDLQGNLRPRIDRDIANHMLTDMVFDTSKLTAAGFECTFHDYRSAVRDVLDWYRMNRWIP